MKNKPTKKEGAEINENPRGYLSGCGVDAGMLEKGHAVISSDLDHKDDERNQERLGRKRTEAPAQKGQKESAKV